MREGGRREEQEEEEEEGEEDEEKEEDDEETVEEAVVLDKEETSVQDKGRRGRTIIEWGTASLHLLARAALYSGRCDSCILTKQKRSRSINKESDTHAL